MKRTAATSAVLLVSVLLSGCGAKLPPLKTVASVDLPRFMGDWYVIASIPTFIEKGAHNAVESYRLDTDRPARLGFRAFELGLPDSYFERGR